MPAEHGFVERNVLWRQDNQAVWEADAAVLGESIDDGIERRGQGARWACRHVHAAAQLDADAQRPGVAADDGAPGMQELSEQVGRRCGLGGRWQVKHGWLCSWVRWAVAWAADLPSLLLVSASWADFLSDVALQSTVFSRQIK